MRIVSEILMNYTNKYIILILAVMLSMAKPLYSDNESFSGKDSVKKVFPEINVEADKIIDDNLKFTSFTQISDKVVTKIAGNDFAKAITLSPGVFVQDYGGMGGLKTVSLRGTNSQQSLITIEGMRLNSSQNGSFDLNTIPASAFDNIQVIKGGVSALMGGNAIGGVINMEIADIILNEDSIYYDSELLLSYGSFSDYSANSGLKHNENLMAYGFVGEINGSNGDYPFEINEFGRTKVVRRENADYFKVNGMLFLDLDYDKYRNKNIAFIHTSFGGIPGAVLQGNIENASAEFFKYDFMIISKHAYDMNDQLRFDAGLFVKFNDLNYTDTTAITHQPEMNFFTKDFRLEAGANYDINFVDLKFGTSLGYSTLVGDMLQPSVDRYVNRAEFSLSMLANSDDLHLSFGSFKSQAGIRMDAIEDISPFYSPMAGIIYTANFFPANLKLHWSKNFRAASFNEMYYLNYGNINLKPEISTSWNLSLGVFPFEFININSSVFLITTKEQIISVPKGPMNWSARNMAEVLSKGIEVNLSGIFDPISYSLSYTIMETFDNSPQSMTYGK